MRLRFSPTLLRGYRIHPSILNCRSIGFRSDRMILLYRERKMSSCCSRYEFETRKILHIYIFSQTLNKIKKEKIRKIRSLKDLRENS